MIALGSFIAGLTPAVRAELRGYRADFQTPATIEAIDPETGDATTPSEHAECAFSPPQVVFSVGFLGGIEAVGETMFGVEHTGAAGAPVFLVAIPREDCAIGVRISSDPIGLPNLESLASCDDDTLLSASFVFASHVGHLVHVSPITGIGFTVGEELPFDVRITGLACDPSDGLLWAVTSGFGGREPELWRIHPETAAATLVGALGLPANSVEGLALLDGRLLAAGTQLHEINPSTGLATAIGGDWAGSLWGLTTLPAPCLPESPDADSDGFPDCADGCPLDPVKIAPGACGCGVEEDLSDTDGDGIIACFDICPDSANPSQSDTDGDGAGDACDGCVVFWSPPGETDLPCSGAWGDVAPQGGGDGLIRLSDIVQVMLFIAQAAGPGAEDPSRADVAPATIVAGSPPVAHPEPATPRVLDAADVALLVDAVLGRVEFADPA